jgi:hypothetical protein
VNAGDHPLVDPLLAQLFAGFTAAGVRWCVLRGEAFLAAPGRDVDVLIAAADTDSAEDVIFAVRGAALPRRAHKWQRNYLLVDSAQKRSVTLDLVTALAYGPRHQLLSDLGRPCLARRQRRGTVFVLDPTDAFWTVLLHCVLDKQEVTPRRAAELHAALDHVNRPSEGETFFARLCPPGWSPDRALETARAGDWVAFAELGRTVVRAQGLSDHDSRRDPLDSFGGIGRRVARRAYMAFWRRTGLGATPLALDAAEAAGVDTLVTGIRRSPGLRSVTLLTGDDAARLAAALRSGGYARIGRSWVRATGTGMEVVRVLRWQDQGISFEGFKAVFDAGRPIGGRTHCRRPRAEQVVGEPGNASGEAVTGSR